MQQVFDKKKTFLFLVVSTVVVWLAYYPSIFVPFYLDDTDSIVNNPLLHAANIEPLINSYYASRLVGYLTLWANYQISGLEPAGYHLVNILIHSINGILVFLLAQALLNHFTASAKNGDAQMPESHRFWALLISAIWMLHPLNSQPVIYIVQRLASMATLFMLLTIILYIRTRNSKSISEALPHAALMFLSIAAGLLSKQNFVVVFLFLYFWAFFTEGPVFRRNLLRLTAAGIIAVIFIAPFPFMTDVWNSLDQFTRDRGAPQRLYYFYTQMIVLWEYVFRFFLPVQLQLELSVTLKDSFAPVVALAALSHVVLIGVAFRLRQKIPIFFVGIILFYFSHVIESSVFPIKDLAFEHRTYFGNIGLTMATVAFLRYFIGTQVKGQSRWIYVVFSTFIVLSFFAIFNRATQWQDPLTFYEREVRLSPEHPRANASYGNELAKAGRFEEAETYLKKSIDINLARGTITAGVLNSYMTVLYQQRKFQQAAPIVMMGLKHIHYPVRRSLLLSNLAVGYIYMGYCDFAIGLLEQALKLHPANQDAINNKAYCLQMKN